MTSHVLTNAATALLSASVAFGVGPRVQAEGIPEPSLVMYGVVSDLSAGGSLVSAGTLTWKIQPADGTAAITVTGTLTNINPVPAGILIPAAFEVQLEKSCTLGAFGDIIVEWGYLLHWTDYNIAVSLRP
jgi:hypothetical protein